MRCKLLVAVFLSLVAGTAVTHGAVPGDPAVVEPQVSQAAANEASPVCPAAEPSFLTPAPTPKDQQCAFISVSPCPVGNDCGYRFDGVCCTARCPHPPFSCLTICNAQQQ